MRFTDLVHAAPLLLASACAAPAATRAEGPMQVVERSYESMAVGADWAAIRGDYTADARILRASAGSPDGWLALTADEWFGTYPDQIDEKAEFQVRVLGLEGMVYDRLATVWATVQVYEDDGGDSEPMEFTTVEQISLVLDAGGRWRISHVQYQGAAEDWPPATGFRPSAYGGGGIRPDLRFRISNN